MKSLLEIINSKQFSIDVYELYVEKKGLKSVWKDIINYLDKNGIDSFSKNIVDFYDIGRLYEIGLAKENKFDKKDCGKYYTPIDVSTLMAEMLLEDEKIDNISDVACGCGNLIIEVLKILKQKSLDEFNNTIRNIHLYDIDSIALEICTSRISALFGINKSILNRHKGDFLSKNIKLSKGSYVISNPPYSQIKEIEANWSYKKSISESKDLYVGFIDKIINQSKKAVIISPQSYIVGKKFSLIRKQLFKKGNGEIYSFDNVPGTIFNGKKEGIFNTNTANGVRASILVFNSSLDLNGYRLTHLIRFKTSERKEVLSLSYLKMQLGNRRQNLTLPLKCYVELEEFVMNVINNSTIPIESLTSSSETLYPIYINSSARYFIVGSKKRMERNGIFKLYAKDLNSFYLLYALLNSSYCYLWWRMLDGGILVPKSLLLSIPIPSTLILDQNAVEFVKHLIEHENDYLVYKKNAGVYQESIKFPSSDRDELNELLFGDVNFSILHMNGEEI